MNLPQAVCILAMVNSGTPGFPLPSRLEAACRVVQSSAIAEHWSAETDSSCWYATWASRGLDEWATLVRTAGDRVEILVAPVGIDSVEIWLAEGSRAGGYAGHRVLTVAAPGHERREEMVVELRGLVPWQCR